MQVEDLEYGVETVFIVYLHLLTKLPVPQVLFTVTFSGLAMIYFTPHHFSPQGVPHHLLLPLPDGGLGHPVLPDRPHHLCDPRQLLAEAQQIFEGAIPTIGGYLTNKFLKSREILSMLIVSVGFLLW